MVPHWPRFMKRFGAVLAALWLTACSTIPPGADEAYRLLPDGDLPAFFNCLRDNDITLISAHRGGPAPGYPENAIETMEHMLRQIPAIMEVDVVRSSDGVLYLLHDRTLDRTTTMVGPVAETSWEIVSLSQLEDNDGQLTLFKAPMLSDVLSWTKGRTIVQLDLKEGVSAEEVAAAVKAAEAEQQVVFIAYTTEDAAEILKHLPDALISVTVESAASIPQLNAAGVDNANILAWTGTNAPDPALYEYLDLRDLSILFGTLGGPNSLDNQFAAAGTDSEYAAIAALGVDVIATDRPVAAYQALYAGGLPDAAAACGIRPPR